MNLQNQDSVQQQGNMQTNMEILKKRMCQNIQNKMTKL